MFHDQQHKQIAEFLHKLNEFLDSAEKVALAYQSQFLAAACSLEERYVCGSLNREKAAKRFT